MLHTKLYKVYTMGTKRHYCKKRWHKKQPFSPSTRTHPIYKINKRYWTFFYEQANSSHKIAKKWSF